MFLFGRKNKNRISKSKNPESRRFKLDITASGGVSSMEDVEKLVRLGIYGAIIGKAYYTGAINIEEAVAVVNGGTV